MPESPPVSIVIVSWNALPLLKRFLPSVLATDYPDFEVVLADNASDDNSVAWVQRAHPEVRVISHPENWRFCRGNNEAVRQTTSPYVALLNNDVEVEAGWLRPLVQVMEEQRDVAAVQPKLLQIERRDHFEYAGACGGFIDPYGYPFTRGRIFSKLERDEGQYDDARDIFWATGAALLLRRKALDEVGLLDETLEMHMEEIDLCWRLWKARWRVRVEPSAKVYHLGGGSLPLGDPQKVYYNFRNSFLLLHKHLPKGRMRWIAPKRYALDTLAGARALAGGRPQELAAIVRAHRGYRTMRRLHAPPKADEGVVLPPYERSIVKDFFVHGRRTFSDLPQSSFGADWRAD